MAIKQEKNYYRKQLASTIRELGKWLEDNADGIVPNVELLQDVALYVEINGYEIPVINVEYNYFSEGVIREMRKDIKVCANDIEVSND